MPKGQRNIEKTHCRHGHRFDELNTRWYRSPDGFLHRVCIQCSRNSAKERNARREVKTARRGLTFEERFWPKVNKDGPIPEYRPDLGPCWIWIAGLTHGYGVIGKGGRGAGQIKAHQFTYRLFVGPVPAGMELDHLCRVRACCNPSHLEPVSHRENTLRGTGNSARAALATHCPQGHPYDDANTYVVPKSGHRQCRTCRAVQLAKRDAKRKVAV